MNVMQGSIRQLKNKSTKPRGMVTKPAVVGASLIGPTFNKAATFKTPDALLNKMNAPNSTGRYRSTTTTSKSASTEDSHVILAISEGRGQARGVVGIASIDVTKPVLILCQISDTQTYTNTLTKVNILHPIQVLIPSTFIENSVQSRLFTVLKEQFPNLTVTSVSRSDFNGTKGFEYVTDLCSPVFSSVALIARHKFYALAATSALLKYIEQIKHVIYTAKSIKIDYQEPENTTIIDIDTSDRLELVTSCKYEMKYSSLLAVLDHCVTSVGRKMLRATILQPPCVQQVIEERLDCVQELLENTELMTKLKCVLANVTNIEYTLMFGTMIPFTAESVSDKQLNYTLHLKVILNSLAPLGGELSIARHPIFRKIHQNFINSPANEILTLINDVINEDAHPAKGQAGDLQRCFAIKSGKNGFLDVARKTYTEVIDDMREHVENLSQMYNLPLRVHHTVNKGYHIVLPQSKGLQHLKIADLPKIFIQINQHSNNFSMTTIEMINFGVRLKSNSNQIQWISNIMIYQLLIDIREHIGHLYQLCDDVALLDMLCSLALSSNTTDYIRPRFSEFMEVLDSKHPLLEYMCNSEPVSNSIFASEDFNMQVISGPNMSGKSVYIRQVCMLQIMAQIGCFVPARSATFRICNHLYARIGVDDNLECNASSFMLEMKEMQYVFNTITDTSLIVMDELCRSTSCDEGASIAFAICEKLLALKAYSFIATHFLSLSRLSDLYFNVTNWHMETIEESKSNSSYKTLNYTHKLVKGITNIASYGIKLSRVCGGSKSVSDRAEQLLNYLLPQQKNYQPLRSPTDTEFLRYKTTADLKLLKLKGQFTPEILQEKSQEFFRQTGVPFESSSTTENQENNRKTLDSSSENTNSMFGTINTVENEKNTEENVFNILSDSDSYIPVEDYLNIEMKDVTFESNMDIIPSTDNEEKIPTEENLINTMTDFSTTDPLGIILKTNNAPLNLINLTNGPLNTNPDLSESYFSQKSYIIPSPDNTINNGPLNQINVTNEPLNINLDLSQSYFSQKTHIPSPNNTDNAPLNLINLTNEPLNINPDLSQSYFSQKPYIIPSPDLFDTSTINNQNSTLNNTSNISSLNENNFYSYLSKTQGKTSTPISSNSNSTQEKYSNNFPPSTSRSNCNETVNSDIFYTPEISLSDLHPNSNSFHSGFLNNTFSSTKLLDETNKKEPKRQGDENTNWLNLKKFKSSTKKQFKHYESIAVAQRNQFGQLEITKNRIDSVMDNFWKSLGEKK